MTPATSRSSVWTGIFLPMLAVLFIGLKLTGFIDWSWFWVLAPVWGPFAVMLAIIAICLIGAVLLMAFGVLILCIFDR